ncbi:MAG: hypothetical protein R6W76_10950 [Caldilinea sp.]
MPTPAAYVACTRDALTALFGLNGYIGHDLVSAGCSQDALAVALDNTNPDISSRWNLIAPYWAHCQHTGYAEGVRLAAQAVYGISILSAQALLSPAAALHPA